MKQIELSWNNVHGLANDICRQLTQTQWMPDYVVGITRGGAIPAVLISQYLGVRCEMLKVSLRDDGECESNLWMAEDAFGYTESAYPNTGYAEAKKNILIVDDINDTGRTLQWIKKDWEASCLPNSEDWNDVWHHNVQFATLIENVSSEFKGVDYYGMEINKLEDPQWIVFPWEDWWKK